MKKWDASLKYLNPLCDYGWGLGAAIFLLRLSAREMGISEARDWFQFYLLGGVVALWLSVTVISRFLRSRMQVTPNTELFISAGKIIFTGHAFLVLTDHFIRPYTSSVYIWVWVAAILLALRWLPFLAGNTRASRMGWMAGLVWCLTCCAFLCLRLVNLQPILYVPLVAYALPFIAALWFTARALADRASAIKGRVIPKEYRILCHLFAVYVLCVAHFRTDSLLTPFTIHHWRAQIEPAISIRAGGWLLWDVPSQYGYFQTLLLALLPWKSAWHSFYMLNGTLLTLCSYLIFNVLYRRYPTYGGFVFSLTLAVASSIVMIPGAFDVRGLPSSGALRFVWTYMLAGYVFWLSQRHIATPVALPRHTCLWGNLLWLIGALWSPESAACSTVIWLPALVLLAAAEACGGGQADIPAIARQVLLRLAHFLALVFGAGAVIALYYLIGLGHLPDVRMFMAFPRAIANSSTGRIPGLTWSLVTSISSLNILPCWMFVYFLLAATCKTYLASAPVTARNLVHAAVLYAATAGLWAASSYYVPDSRDFKLLAMLPVLVYLSAIILALMPSLQLPAAARFAYEKGILCFYGILILGTVTNFNPGIFSPRSLAKPVRADVTKGFAAPPRKLQEVLYRSGMPKSSHVLILSQYESALEGTYLPNMDIQPWVLPNTFVSYDFPLPHNQTREFTKRSIERSGIETGWVIERTAMPLEYYPWVMKVILKYYAPAGIWENGEYRIRKFEKLP